MLGGSIDDTTIWADSSGDNDFAAAAATPLPLLVSALQLPLQRFYRRGAEARGTVQQPFPCPSRKLLAMLHGWNAD